ncbi:MAG: PEP-CTERM sorting domain-containing protein [Deltaproteobacteria bacterium]|nr:PEP-CTERM sorting domain-containing protein [Deltaproteobacteria bacterium]MBW2395764.1 PEP-CTERM sorting domain-containing protein [Deltaproteobacteria bacterium]
MLNRRMLSVALGACALMLSAALPAAAIQITEITVKPASAAQFAADGILIDVTDNGGIGTLGELLLNVSGVAPGVVMHDGTRIEFNMGNSRTRYAIEDLAFDWNTGYATGFVGGIKNRDVLFAGVLNVFKLFMAPDGSFEVVWTQEAADVFQMVFGANGGVDGGVDFGKAIVGADPHVPEPGTLILMMGGIVGLARFGRRTRS